MTTRLVETARSPVKARLEEIRWNAQNQAEVVPDGAKFTVQFNPPSLKVTYANQVQTNNQGNNASTQQVGRGSSKLNIELIFDVSMPGAETGDSGRPEDVRVIIEKLAKLMVPRPAERDNPASRVAPPGVRF